MNNLSRDPIINVVENQIKRGIRITLENECYAAAVILIYSGIDTMAYLGMPERQEEVNRKDFVKWADTYIRFPCKEQVSGAELYGARCGMLHTHSITSKLSRQGKVRQIGYMDKSIPEVSYDPGISRDLVLVSIAALADAFFAGVNRFLIETFSDPKKAQVAEARLRTLVHLLPFKQD